MEEENNFFEEEEAPEPDQDPGRGGASSIPAEWSSWSAYPRGENPEDLHDNSDKNCPEEVREQIERLKKLFHVDSLDQITKVTPLNANNAEHEVEKALNKEYELLETINGLMDKEKMKIEKESERLRKLENIREKHVTKKQILEPRFIKPRANYFDKHQPSRRRQEGVQCSRGE